MRAGSWWLSSKSDKRWNTHGTADFIGGLKMPQECKQALKNLRQKYGEPPADLEWGYMKD